MPTEIIPPIYQWLNMPTDDHESIEVGEFQPSDVAPLIEHIAELRLKQLRKAHELATFPENKRLLQQQFPLFHTYHDFKISQKRETPTRTEELPEGHSLQHHHTDAAGYLDYLMEKSPDLASFFFTRMRARIPESERKGHTYVLGKAKSGKTELLKIIINAYLRINRKRLKAREKPACTIIVIDPHGDFATQVAKWKENSDGNFILVDPFLDKRALQDPSKAYFPCLNPYQIEKPTPLAIHLTNEAINDAFAQVLQGEFTTQMEMLLTNCNKVLMERKGSSMADLLRFMDDNRNDDLVALGSKSQNPTIRDFFASGAFFNTTYNRTKTALATRIQALFSSDPFYRLLVGKSTINIRELMNSRKLVVFNLAKGNLGKQTSQALGRFLVTLIHSEAMQRVNTEVRYRVPVHCFIDEFSNYVTPSMGEALEEARKFGLHLTMAQQYYGQHMDTKFADSVMGNTMVKIVGRNEDKTTTKMSSSFKIPSADMSRLFTGEFWVKSGDVAKPYKLYCPKFLLGGKNAMTGEQWEIVKELQFQRYYRLVSEEQTEPPADQRPPIAKGIQQGSKSKGRQTGLPSQQDNLDGKVVFGTRFGKDDMKPVNTFGKSKKPTPDDEND